MSTPLASRGNRGGQIAAPAMAQTPIPAPLPNKTLQGDSHLGERFLAVENVEHIP